jgi:TonB family protein
MRCAQLIAIGLMVGIAGAQLRAQDTLETAKSLYASAAYEDALKMLGGLANSSAPDARFAIDQYRAFCLIALGRTSDAQQVIEQIVRQNALYQPTEQETSPRMRTAFREIRRRVLPGAAHAAYAAGKSALEAKRYAESVRAFKEALALLDDSDIGDAPLYRDLRTVAAGFLELATSAALTPSDTTVAAANAPTSPAATPAAETAASPPAPRRPYFLSDDPDVIPPAVVYQQAPSWPVARGVPPPARVGLLSILISELGTVESATLVQPLHPAYDQDLLAAAKKWRYKPATKDGVAVKYLKTIKITLNSAQSSRPTGGDFVVG